MERHLLLLSTVLLLLISIGGSLAELELDPHFSVNPYNIELTDIGGKVNLISGAVMGTAEVVLQIKSDLKLIRKELMMGKMNMRFEGRKHGEYGDLADRLERVYAENDTATVDLAKEEIRKVLRSNFVRVLAAMLLHGPPSAKGRSDDILRLMRSVLNDELDFKPVVEKLPFILRESETTQFIKLVQAINEENFPKVERQDEEDPDDPDEPDQATNAPQTQQPQQPQETFFFVQQPQGQGQQQVQAIPSGTNNYPGSVPSQNNQNPGNLTQQGLQTTTKPPLKIIVQQAAAPPPPTSKPQTSAQTSGLNSVINAVNGLDADQFTNLLGNLPDLFEGIDTIVGGFESFIGE